MGSFIDKVEEKRRQRQRENAECKKRENFKKLVSQGSSLSSVNLNEFKTMLKAVQHPKSKELELWKTDGALGFKNRYRKHHDQYMLENLDVAQAVRIYQQMHPIR